MVLDLCWTEVLAKTDTSIFSGIVGIFQYWYRYRNNSIASLKTRVNLSFHPRLSTEEDAGDEDWLKVGMLPVGQVGAKHRQVACASLLN